MSSITRESIGEVIVEGASRGNGGGGRETVSSITRESMGEAVNCLILTLGPVGVA